MKDNNIVIDKSRILLNKETSMDVIFDYFSDFEIEITETRTHYHLEITRSNFLYCDDAEKGLKWLGIQKRNVRDFYIIGQQSFFCLLESWIPYGWSRVMAEAQYIPDSLTIIHLDDHTDLMSPKILSDNGKWKDMFTGEIYNFSEPESIKKAVQSGAITLGSMMTPLIHYIEHVDVLHLKQNTETIVRYIEKTTYPDSLIDPEQKRMSITLTDTTKSKNSSTYFRTPDLLKIIQRVPPETDIFLHVDMDFFNNRFDGSTDWANHHLKHNPSLDKQKEFMSFLCQNMLEAGLVDRIKHLSIGVSPSFYPSEYWREGITYLLSEFNSINLKLVPQIKNQS